MAYYAGCVLMGLPASPAVPCLFTTCNTCSKLLLVLLCRQWAPVLGTRHQVSQVVKPFQLFLVDC